MTPETPIIDCARQLASERTDVDELFNVRSIPIRHKQSASPSGVLTPAGGNGHATHGSDKTIRRVNFRRPRYEPDTFSKMLERLNAPQMRRDRAHAWLASPEVRVVLLAASVLLLLTLTHFGYQAALPPYAP